MASYVERLDFLGEALTKYREANFFSQKDIADIIGVSRSTYSYYELGKIEPSIQTLSMLAKIYDISIENFLPPEKNINRQLRDIERNKNKQNQPSLNMGDLTSDERLLIAKFRLADMQLKRAVIKELAKKIDEISKNKQ